MSCLVPKNFYQNIFNAAKIEKKTSAPKFFFNSPIPAGSRTIGHQKKTDNWAPKKRTIGHRIKKRITGHQIIGHCGQLGTE
jgi:hypothetical protein